MTAPIIKGVGRDAAYPRCLIVYTDSEPTDEHVRQIQELLAPSDPLGTHFDDCWRFHHVCAIALVERLQAQVVDLSNRNGPDWRKMEAALRAAKNYIQELGGKT